MVVGGFLCWRRDNENEHDFRRVRSRVKKKQVKMLNKDVPLQLGWMHHPSCIPHHLSHIPGLAVKCACGRLPRGVHLILVLVVVVEVGGVGTRCHLISVEIKQ
jgi:hypothetical protein